MLSVVKEIIPMHEGFLATNNNPFCLQWKSNQTWPTLERWQLVQPRMTRSKMSFPFRLNNKGQSVTVVCLSLSPLRILTFLRDKGATKLGRRFKSIPIHVKLHRKKRFNKRKLSSFHSDAAVLSYGFKITKSFCFSFTSKSFSRSECLAQITYT